MITQDVPVDLHIKTMAGYKGSLHYHVFELTSASLYDICHPASRVGQVQTKWKSCKSKYSNEWWEICYILDTLFKLQHLADFEDYSDECLSSLSYYFCNHLHFFSSPFSDCNVDQFKFLVAWRHAGQ